MMMSHPLIPASLAPASVSMAMGQMNRLSTLASMANVAQLHAKHLTRAPTSVIKVREAQRPSTTLWGLFIHSFIHLFTRIRCHVTHLELFGGRVVGRTLAGPCAAFLLCEAVSHKVVLPS